MITVGVLFFMSNNGNAQSKVIRRGSRVPEVILPDTSGVSKSLSSLRGKVVLIDFWASWCGPCRRANPGLSKIYNRFQSKGFEVFGISVDRSATAWKQAVIADKLNWLHVRDDGFESAVGVSQWQIDYIPTSVLVNKEGEIVAVNPAEREVIRYLKKHLK